VCGDRGVGRGREKGCRVKCAGRKGCEECGER
jgi:hypothetical protein